MLGDLSKKYESNGDPGAISTGWGDLGGKSYGMYQMASELGVVEDFLKWAHAKGYYFAWSLMQHPVGTKTFDDTWQACADRLIRIFPEAQHRYIQEKYFDVAEVLLREAMYDLDRHTEVMADVVWSRAVQYGPHQIVEMFTEACNSLGYPNLSYVDDKYFDEAMIKAVYLNVCRTPEWTNGSPDLRAGLYSRFEWECEEALDRLRKEGEHA